MTLDKQEHTAERELTQSQSLLWLGQKLNPDAALYNMAYSFTIDGDLDIEVFQTAFQLLMLKMDVFRTVFFEKDGVPYQKVLPDYDYRLEVLDFTGKKDAGNTLEANIAKGIISEAKTVEGKTMAGETIVEEAKTGVAENIETLQTETAKGEKIAGEPKINIGHQTETTDAEIRTWLKERTARMFDFALPLFDSVLLKIEENRYIWYLNFHHIITDATSSTLILKKMSEIYGQLRSDDASESADGQGSVEGREVDNHREIAVAPPFTSYVDFEAEQRNRSRDSVHEYWKKKLADIRETPVFYGRKNVKPTSATRRVSFSLDADTTKNIKELAKRTKIRAFTESLTLFNIFAALLFSYIYRVSGQNRLALGAIAHNRLTRQFKATAGLFMEIFPLTDALSEDDTFKSVLERVRTESNNFIRYAQPGLASADMGRSFNVVLNYINVQFSDFDGFPMQAEWIHPGRSDASHHLRCHVYDLGDSENMEIHFDLNADIFPDALFKKVPDHFTNLAKALVADINRPILDPPLLGKSEKDALVSFLSASAFSISPNPSALPSSQTASSLPSSPSRSQPLLPSSPSRSQPSLPSSPSLSQQSQPQSSTVTPLDKSPHEFDSIITEFEKRAQLRPNAVALQSKSSVLTYRELKNRIDHRANILSKRGIGAKHKILLHLERNVDYVISLLAVLKSGAAFVPVPSDQPVDRVAFIAQDSGCSLAITSPNLQKNIASETVESWVLNSQADDGISPPEKNISNQSIENTSLSTNVGSNPSEATAYILYTSGSTGTPKGVEISQKALANYMDWAGSMYRVDETTVFPLFTSIGFDLTLTATLLPLLHGGRVVVYPEKRIGPDLALMEVFDDNLATHIKLTPSHLALLKDKDFSTSQIRTMIVGGEDFKVGLAKSISAAFPEHLRIFNEYGPTEATIGCIVSKFDALKHTAGSVPIGKPIDQMQAYVLDTHKNLVPTGVIGELYLSGMGLAKCYLGNQRMNSKKFLENPFSEQKNAAIGQENNTSDKMMYRTGDRARINLKGEFEYLGRIDDQVKLRGYRIEPADIESNLALHPTVENAAIVLTEKEERIPKNEVANCVRCGLPSNYPNTDFDQGGVCHLCTAFDTYKEKVEGYFKNDEELVRVLTSKRGGETNLKNNSSYDCISLLSGGKDSTYVLARLVDMGLNVLAFTMDNGYISQQAKNNIDRITGRLDVDHVYGETPHMNDIFVDSLHRHHNVCNGCFKTIYTLSTQIALEKNIPFIVTGLSRGQFFETRLTEELFWDDSRNSGQSAESDIVNGSSQSLIGASEIDRIDHTILEARKLYHREPDAVKELLDVSAFESDTVFEKVQFVDFYRYSDVSLEEMLVYLNDKIGWVRPTDTGRSTNCLINQVGIYVHKKEEGYSNYAFPYSWDVRLGHKKREESLEEINEAIDENEVLRIMEEIGYEPSLKEDVQGQKLIAYYTGEPGTSVKVLRDFLAQKLPSYMIPVTFKHLETLPMTPNGKVDKKALLKLNSVQLDLNTPYVAPRNDIEELLESIWKEVLRLEKVGVYDDFIALGGHSLAAIRVTARINEAIETDFPLSKIFEFPTLAEYAKYIEETLTHLMEQ